MRSSRKIRDRCISFAIPLEIAPPILDNPGRSRLTGGTLNRHLTPRPLFQVRLGKPDLPYASHPRLTEKPLRRHDAQRLAAHRRLGTGGADAAGGAAAA